MSQNRHVLKPQGDVVISLFSRKMVLRNIIMDFTRKSFDSYTYLFITSQPAIWSRAYELKIIETVISIMKLKQIKRKSSGTSGIGSVDLHQ